MICTFAGKVTKGDGYGRKIGYPTMNIDRRNFMRLSKKPVLGVYAGSVEVSGKTYRAGIVIGPVDKKGMPKLEAHLLGYKGSAYGKKVIFKLEKFIRKFRRFNGERELISQIEKDLAKC